MSTPRKNSGRTQEERSLATRQRIVKSALKLLRTKGVRGANLQEIARGARVTLGALQHHFRTRQILMEHLVDEVLSPLADDGNVWPSSELPLDDRARFFVNGAWENIYGVPSYVATWSLYFGCKESPSLFARIDANRRRMDPIFFARFISCFPELKKAHRDPDSFAGLVFASLRGMAMLGLFDAAQTETRGQLDALVDHIVAACQSEGEGVPD